LVSCQWKAEGYGKSDIPLSEPTLAEDSPFSIKFGKWLSRFSLNLLKVSRLRKPYKTFVDEALQADVLRKAHEQNPTMKIG
jgi:hypothetical protein